MEENGKVVYTAEVTSTGGRNGHVKSSDGIIDMGVTVPEGLGGKGGSTNPEQLFAAGYSSCFLSALQVVSKKQHVHLDDSANVMSRVKLLRFDNGGYGLSVDLEVDLPGVDKEQARQLVDAAHEICPYSVGTRGNIDVQLHVK